MDFSEVTAEDGYDGLGLVPVRLRGDDDAGGWWGYSFVEGRWDWRADLGVLYSSTGFVPNLGADDCQENYWVVETADGVRYAFQSIDVEPVSVVARPRVLPTVEAIRACDRAYRLVLVWCQYVGQAERLDSGVIGDIVADLLVMAEAQYDDTAERVAGRALLNARAELDGDDLTTTAV